MQVFVSGCIMPSNDPITIWATRIKRKNKRMLKELIQAFFLLLGIALFITTCWGFDRFVNGPAPIGDAYTLPKVKRPVP